MLRALDYDPHHHQPQSQSDMPRTVQQDEPMDPRTAQERDWAQRRLVVRRSCSPIHYLYRNNPPNPPQDTFRPSLLPLSSIPHHTAPHNSTDTPLQRSRRIRNPWQYNLPPTRHPLAPWRKRRHRPRPHHLRPRIRIRQVLPQPAHRSQETIYWHCVRQDANTTNAVECRETETLEYGCCAAK